MANSNAFKFFTKEEADEFFNEGKSWQPYNTTNSVLKKDWRGYQYIPLKFAIILGNVDTGQVLVFDRRNEGVTNDLYYGCNGPAYGACEPEWRDYSPARRMEELMSFQITLTTSVGFTAKAVHYGLLDINEYRAMIAVDELHTITAKERDAIKEQIGPIEITPS